MEQLIRKWVMSCQQGIKKSRFDINFTRQALQNPIEYITAPEDDMQIDLEPELFPSGGYEDIVTVMDVFCCCLFDYSTSNQEAKTIAKVFFNIMTKHAYLSTKLISDERFVFVSHVLKKWPASLAVLYSASQQSRRKQLGC